MNTTVTTLVLALVAIGIPAFAQTPAAAPAATPTATGITFAQYQNDVQTMEANADYAKAESDYNDAQAKYDAINTDGVAKIQAADNEIKVREDAYREGTTLNQGDADRDLASVLKPFRDIQDTNKAIIYAARKIVMAKGLALSTLEIQLLPTIDPAMADVAARGKAYLAELTAQYQQPPAYAFQYSR